MRQLSHGPTPYTAGKTETRAFFRPADRSSRAPAGRAGGRLAVAAVVAVSLAGAACGSDPEPVASVDPAAQQELDDDSSETESDRGVRLVSPSEAAAIQAEPPEGLVILDVRTPEEFADGHLDGAIMIDFYEDDFVDRLSALDPETPYLLYCRSGNRSGKTAAILEDLGFTDVADVDGGVVAWADSGLPLADR